MLLSLTLQIVAVASGVIISILTVDKLGAFSLPQPMPPAPRSFNHVKVIKVRPHGSTAPTKALHAPVRPLFEPNRIPAAISRIIDGPQMYAEAAPLIGGTDRAYYGPVDLVPSGASVLSTPTAIAPPPPLASPTKTPPPERLRIGGNVLQAKLVKQVMPVYPPLAKQARISGTVRLLGVVSKDGRVINLQLISGHPLLAPVALEAVSQWAYRPTLLNGVPVEVVAPIEVHFTLAR